MNKNSRFAPIQFVEYEIESLVSEIDAMEIRM